MRVYWRWAPLPGWYLLGPGNLVGSSYVLLFQVGHLEVGVRRRG